MRQTTELAATKDATPWSKPVKSVESTTHTNTKSEPSKAVVTAMHHIPVDPVISYTEASCDIMNTLLYIMVWIWTILKSIIIINVLVVS